MAKRGQLNLLTASAAAERIAAGSLTSVALVEACLARIAEREDDVHAWAFVDRDLALAQACARDAESPRGVLHGVPVGIKVTRADFDAAVREAQGARAIIARVFQDYDVLITPAATGEAPADLTVIEGGSFNTLWTHLYVPCVTIPAFSGPNGMPVGLQVVAAHGADEALLGAAAAIAARLKQTLGKLPIRVG